MEPRLITKSQNPISHHLILESHLRSQIPHPKMCLHQTTTQAVAAAVTSPQRDMNRFHTHVAVLRVSSLNIEDIQSNHIYISEVMQDSHTWALVAVCIWNKQHNQTPVSVQQSSQSCGQVLLTTYHLQNDPEVMEALQLYGRNTWTAACPAVVAT